MSVIQIALFKSAISAWQMALRDNIAGDPSGESASTKAKGGIPPRFPALSLREWRAEVARRSAAALILSG